MENGASAEIAVVGNEVLVGVSLFRARRQSDGTHCDVPRSKSDPNAIGGRVAPFSR
jgi:hypothetical protein